MALLAGCTPTDNTPTGTESAASTEDIPTGKGCPYSNYPPECMKQVCALHQCKRPDSVMDEIGCMRKPCANDTDCGSDTRCQYVWELGVWTEINADTGECLTSMPDIMLMNRRCMPYSASSPELECHKPNVSADCLDSWCSHNGCGAYYSFYDSFGCRRQSCVTDSDCGDDAGCIPIEDQVIGCRGLEPGATQCQCDLGPEFVADKVCVPHSLDRSQPAAHTSLP